MADEASIELRAQLTRKYLFFPGLDRLAGGTLQRQLIWWRVIIHHKFYKCVTIIYNHA
jgi:hypothetical protein